ncbi:MAG: hypothetical protein ABF624_00410 [Liquorilactobacillus ghanensis]|uniref:hypothetical protein n=1 Tax=Liquorilactobacillus ghanensis TaxID=399370 RepID=UPI0039EA29A8
MVYEVDNNGYFTSENALTDTATDSKHQTTVPLPDGIYLPAKFDFTSQKWVGSDRPAAFDEASPTVQQTINANLILRVATLTAKIAKLEGSASNG